MATFNEVAEYMLNRLRELKYLYQDVIVYDIASRFGDEFVYYNKNGNPAISQAVLREFRKLTKNTVVWERGERFWRERGPYDSPGRQQE